MALKYWVTIGLVVGSTLGGWLPSLWDQSLFSLTSTVGTFIGGVLGIWLGYKLGQMYS